MNADDDAALMIAVRGGDERAFTTLVRRWQDRIVSLANRYLRSAADAEDVSQEVFLRVHRARETYEPSAKFSTWIYRITVNASLNHIRSRKARKAVSGELRPAGDGEPGGLPEPADPNEPDPTEGPEKDELARVIREILDELPERQRTAILLNKYQGLGYEESAAAMELSIPAVKSLLTRARVAIKERLEPYLTTGEWPRERDPRA
ncbi:MAG: sigma-70 family RNA polymerase sigma factor [Planctomycetes bacterium]|nr:sigma-70 family RNA polymerase sigma factor [Planctomycetota bacterium]